VRVTCHGAGSSASNPPRGIGLDAGGRRARELCRSLAAGGALYRQGLRAADLAAPDDVRLAVELRAAAVTALAQAGDALGGPRPAAPDNRARRERRSGPCRCPLGLGAPLVWSVRALNQPDPVLPPALRRVLAVPRPDAVRARLLCALFLELENFDDAGADA
jgi:hypothetical protein